MKLTRSSRLAAMAVVLSAGCLQTVAARDFADIYTECGLGAMIAPSNAAVAAVTNVTWDLGTTAISSNISSDSTCSGGKPKAAAMIMESYPQIERDIAAGQGQYLTALLAVSGCRTEAHAPVAAALRTSLSRSVAQPDYGTRSRYELARELYSSLTQRVDGEFAAACTPA